MQLVRAAGQLLEVAELPQNAQVKINGTVAVPNADGLYALPVGQAADVVVARGEAELFRASVPATAAGERRRIVVPARPVAVAYEPGSRDDIRNRAAKGKAAMSLFGLGAAVGAGVALVKLWRS
jgi:hypothetical protein